MSTVRRCLTSLLVRFASWTLALAVCTVCPVEAGMQNNPCLRPFVFDRAAVNVVVLPYETAPGLRTGGDLGDRLARLLQLEALRSIAKFGSVGAVHMSGTPRECDPDTVIAKLLGARPGALARVRPGHGLVVVWGRFFDRGGTIYVQTFIRMLRVGAAETLDLTAGGQPFSAAISAPAFACAPRRVEARDLELFERQFIQSTIVRPSPYEGSGGTRMGAAPVPFWITDTRGEWMKIESEFGGPQGWIHVGGPRDAWSLVRWLPELSYIEGIVGYLRHRVARSLVTTSNPMWLELAGRALAEYERSLDVDPAGTPGGEVATRSNTALAGAVQFQLRGIIFNMRPGAAAPNRTTALTMFQRGAALLPHDASARTLVTTMQFALAIGNGPSEVTPLAAADQMLQILGSEPDNRTLFGNVRSAYRALLERPPPDPPLLTAEQRRTVSERLVALERIAAARAAATSLR